MYGSVIFFQTVVYIDSQGIVSFQNFCFVNEIFMSWRELNIEPLTDKFYSIISCNEPFSEMLPF